MNFTYQIFAGFLAVSIAGVVPPPIKPTAVAADMANLQIALQSEYDNMNAAMANGNGARYLSYHTFDYRETDSKGSWPPCEGRAQERVQTRNSMQWIKHFDAVNHDHFHYRDTIENIAVTGNSIAVTAEEHSSIQPQLVEQEHDVWVKQGGRWLIKQRLRGTMHGAEIKNPPPSDGGVTQVLPP